MKVMTGDIQRLYPGLSKYELLQAKENLDLYIRG